ncbi:circularly permuted type 2 ATP-grasp protein [Alkanindiges sp. WGS2144]|uniref:circularly permuted type 2 ATP-grasp protein n=1 Tax=Alkanindiges sp. WGS2144 TaxID=3366808 RepID=UPI003751860D
MTLISGEIYENLIHFSDKTPVQELNQHVATQFFSEVTHDTGDIRQSYQHFMHWLNQQSIEQLKTLSEQATAHFYKKGITFTVYHDADGTERVIPFDIIPRIIEQKEWQVLHAGCEQRIRALNAFLHDVYHKQDIIRSGIVPAEQVIAHDSFQPWMLNVDLPGQVYAHVSGIDLIRDGSGQYYVLEDNLRTPSGVSYMLEGRAISQQLMPDIFARQHIATVHDYPALLKQTLVDSSAVTNPTIVIWTPGRFNSAYYEHAFLARAMDVPLVSSFDLFVEKDEVFLKSIRGPIKVDMIYRRLDDPFLDPLAFRPDSMLGVPGLMAAYRAGKVMIANAPGTGVADDKSVYPYVPDMIKFYLGEKPVLNNVPTWQCRKKDDLNYVLSHLSELVVKETQGSGGYGMLIGPKASQCEKEEFKQRILKAPANYIAQPTLALSVCPALVEEGIAPRHIDLRPFVLSSPGQVRIVPGGLTRVALNQGSLVVNSSQGGGIKDTWIVSSENSRTSLMTHSMAGGMA